MKLAEGEVAKTASGRNTSPFPKIDFFTDRKTKNTLRRVDVWLKENAIEEAKSKNDEYGLLLFECMNTSNMSDADRNLLNIYLFNV